MSAELVLRPMAAARSVIDSLVHPSAHTSPGTSGRHAALIRSHLLGGLLAAVVFTGYFVYVGGPKFAALVALTAFLAPLAIAAYLSRTGALTIAHAMTASQLAAIIVVAASLSGGSASFAVAWLLLVPVEAALSADRRMMVLTGAISLLALVGLHAATLADALPAAAALRVDPRHVAIACHLAGIGYAVALVATIQAMHRDAQREIEASRAAYHLIAENTSDLITRHDAGGRVLYASRAAVELLGVAPDALCGEGLASLLDAEDGQRYRQSFSWCGDSGQPTCEIYRIERAGAPQWLEMRCRRTCEVDGATTIVAVTRDVTARQLQTLRDADARTVAEEASRAKSAFIAAMSHELRTPLNAIIGFAELLHRELLIKAREPKHAEYCRIIHESGEHLLSLVRDLLDVSKIEAGKLSTCPEPFDLTGVITGSVDTLRPAALAKQLAIDVEIAPSLPEIVADRRACKQILINLLSNACKFTPEGRQITIAAGGTETAVYIAVSDSGIGIAASDIARLGEPFFQVDAGYSRQHEGAGLGLTIVRGLIALQNGRLLIESEPGRGSTFTVVLPIDVEACDGPEQLSLVDVPIGRAPAAREDHRNPPELAMAS